MIYKKKKLFIVIFGLTIFTLIIFTPSVYKLQLREFISPSFKSMYQDNFYDLHNNNIVDFTSSREIIFVCIAHSENSANARAKQFAEEQGLKYNDFFDFISFFTNLSSFYLINSAGEVRILSFRDERLFSNSSRKINSKKYSEIKSGCQINNAPIFIHYNDT